MVNVVENCGTILENIPSTVQSKGSTGKQDQKLNKSECCGQKTSLMKYNTSFLSPKSQDDVQLQACAQMDEDADNSQEVIDLSSPQKDSR